MATREIAKLINRARKGESSARLELGRLYLSGTRGMAPNSAAALNWLVEAWDDGCREAAHEIARIASIDVFPGGKRESYLAACSHAAASGSAAANFALGEAYAGAGLLDKAAACYRSAAEQGHARSAFRLGRLLLERALGDSNAESARDWLEEAAEHGETDAIAPLADMLEKAGDPAAIPWLRRLAAAGDLQAMVGLAQMLLRCPTREAVVEVRGLLSMAAQKGEPTALWLWGRMQVRQFREPGLKELGAHSRRKAMELLKRAADLGVAEAHWDLARLYAQPQTLTTDQFAARRHLEAAADAGIPGAQLQLARRLIQRRDDPVAWLRAGQLLIAARADAESREFADRLLDEISDRAAPPCPQTFATQRVLLNAIEKRFPQLASRLRLAVAFGLTTREVLFIEPRHGDRGWCLLADLSTHFRYQPWRLIRIETEMQREALSAAASAAFPGLPAERDLSAGATTRVRARHLSRILQHELQIDPAIFIHDWQPPG